ncbi:MAG: hypothetical protein GF307_07405 [candidate division Zixibacteria bacterium]|nr:hypothetical protein [candidate division Zixibacteria bacterium]
MKFNHIKIPLVLLIGLLFFLSALTARAESNVVCAYFIGDGYASEIINACDKIIEQRVKGEKEIAWLIPGDILSARDNGGLFLKPDKEYINDYIYNSVLRDNYRYLIEYNVSKIKMDVKRDISIPYIVSRFKKRLKVYVDYRVIDARTGDAELDASFDFTVDCSQHAQYLEFDPERADILYNALEREDTIKRAAQKASAIIIDQLRTLSGGGLLASGQ